MVDVEAIGHPCETVDYVINCRLGREAQAYLSEEAVTSHNTRTHTLLVNELVSCHTSLTEISRRHTVTVHTEKGTLSQYRQVRQGQQ